MGLLLGFAVPSAADTVPPWPAFQHDIRHTGRSALAGPGQAGVKWTFPTIGHPGSPAVGADGTIYLPAGLLNSETTGYLYAINPNGTQKWRFTLPGPPSATAPALGPDGTIYVHANGQGNIASIENLTAINPNGTEKWQIEFGGGAAVPSSSDQSAPAVAPDGKIWIGSGDTGLYRLNPADGSTACAVTPTNSSIDSSPAIATDGTVYIVDVTTTLFAFEPDCDPKWDFQLSDEFMGTANPQSPSIAADGTVYVGSPDERFYAVNPNGTLKCSFTTSSGIDSTPAIATDGTVYVGSDGLYALTPNCTKRWEFAPGALFSSTSPIIDSDGTIYWRESFTAHAVNPDGSQKWSLPVDPGSSSGNDPSGAIGEGGVLYLADGGFTGPTRLRAIADTMPPETTITSGPTGSTNDSTPTFSFSSSEAPSTFQCRVDAAAFAPCTSPRTTQVLSDGTHTFEVRATDAAGNTDASAAARPFTVDTVPPQTTISDGPAEVTNDSTPTFSFSSSQAGSSFQCRVDAAAFSACSSPRTTAALPDGGHTFEVRATDPAGNTDATPVERAFTVDTDEPETTILSGPMGRTRDRSPRFRFESDEDTSTFACRLDRRAWRDCESPKEYGHVSLGRHTFRVRSTDQADNTDSSPARRTFRVVAA